MAHLDYWRLCERVTIPQAALLMSGHDPADYTGIEKMNEKDWPKNFYASFWAIKDAIIRKELVANIEREFTLDEVGQIFSLHEQLSAGKDIFDFTLPDFDKATINLTVLNSWLKKKGFQNGLFGLSEHAERRSQDYLDPYNEFYSPKLAAAVDAWLYVSNNPDSYAKTSPKQAAIAWLEKNAETYNLLKEDFSPNYLGIEEVAKVMNWDIKGGAPRSS